LFQKQITELQTQISEENRKVYESILKSIEGSHFFNTNFLLILAQQMKIQEDRIEPLMESNKILKDTLEKIELRAKTLESKCKKAKTLKKL